MINPERENAIKINELYKENNKETEEVISEWIPEKRMFVYTKVKTDPNAIKMQQYLKSGRKEKKVVKAPKKKALKKVSANPKVIKPKKATSVLVADIPKVYKDHEEGLTHQELSNKYQVVIRAVRIAISKHLLSIGKGKVVRSYDTVNQVESLLEQGFNKKEIAKKLNREPHTILYHINNLKKKAEENENK